MKKMASILIFCLLAFMSVFPNALSDTIDVNNITLYTQNNYNSSSWELYGYSGRNLKTSGCIVFTFAHAIEWLTKGNCSNTLINDLYSICSDPNGKYEHKNCLKGSHKFDKQGTQYSDYAEEKYGIVRIPASKTDASFKNILTHNGVIVMLCPNSTGEANGHYILVCEYKTANNVGYIHIIDSHPYSLYYSKQVTFFDDNQKPWTKLKTQNATDYWIEVSKVLSNKGFSVTCGLENGFTIDEGIESNITRSEYRTQTTVDAYKGASLDSSVLESLPFGYSIVVTHKFTNPQGKIIWYKTEDGKYIQADKVTFVQEAPEIGRYTKVADISVKVKQIKYDSVAAKSEPYQDAAALGLPVKKGDILAIQAVYKNKYDNHWLQLIDGRYICANNVEVVENVMGPMVSDPVYPKENQNLNTGESFGLRGIVSCDSAMSNIVGGVYLQSTNLPYNNGNETFEYSYSTNKDPLNIQNTLNNKIKFGGLERGDYIFRVTASYYQYKNIPTNQEPVPSPLEEMSRTLIETHFTVGGGSGAAVPVTAVKLSNNEKQINIGSSFDLTVNIFPANATIKALTWISDNPAVATVSNGNVKGVSAGKAVITAYTTDGSGLSASCSVQVIAETESGTTYSATDYIALYSQCKDSTYDSSKKVYTLSYWDKELAKRGVYVNQETTDKSPGISNDGCRLLSFVHLTQYLTEKAPNVTAQVDLLEKFAKLAEDPSQDSAGAVYDKYLMNTYAAEYSIKKCSMGSQPTFAALMDFFNNGGAAVVRIPGHFFIIIGAVERDGVQYLQAVDSSRGSTIKRLTTQTAYKYESFQSYKVTVGDGVAEQYWIPYDVFIKSNCMITNAYTSENRVKPSIAAETLQFSNVQHPTTYLVGSVGGWKLGSGTLASDYELKTIHSAIKTTGGQVISTMASPLAISGKSFAIATLDTYSSTDNGVKFSKIKSAGDYLWVLTATDNSGRTLTLEMPFTAVSTGSTQNGIISKKCEDPEHEPVSLQIQRNGLIHYGDIYSYTLGDSFDYDPVVYPLEADQSVTWESSDPLVATVTQDGVIKIIGYGEAIIKVASTVKPDVYLLFSVYSSNQPEIVNVYLYNAPMEEDKNNMTVTEIWQLDADVYPPTASQKVIWLSSNPSVASVSDDGVLRALAPGYSIITVKSAESPSISHSFTLNVIDNDELTITLNEHYLFFDMSVEDTYQFSTLVTPYSEAGNRVIWESENDKTATVNGNGLITLNAPGATIITCSLASNLEILDSCYVVVIDSRPESGLYLPASLKEIDDKAFVGDASITNVIIPDGLQRIGKEAFKDCENLEWIMIPDSVTQIDPTSFDWDIVIFCNRGSYAEAFAIENHMLYLLIGCDEDDVSDWVPESEVPTGATIVDRSWSFRENLFAMEGGLEEQGYILDGTSWVQVGNGSTQYASFPAGYDTSNTYYSEMAHEPYMPFDNGTTKREVVNVKEGYIYWHWMYNAVWADTINRSIASTKGQYTYQSSNGETSAKANYYYFFAFASPVDCPSNGTTTAYNRPKGPTVETWNCASVIKNVSTEAQRNSNTSGVGCNRFYRFIYGTSSYTDYEICYQYHRDWEYADFEPESDMDYSNLQAYVKYMK